MALKKSESYLVLDLGSYSIKVLLGNYDGSSIKVSKAFVVKTPEGTYYDGKIADIESVASAIKAALKENGIKEKKCIVTFTSKDVIQKELSVPELSYEDTIGLIKYEISQYLPINVDEYDIAYKNIYSNPALLSASDENTSSENIDVFSYIVKKTLVDDLHSLVLACSLEPKYLDFHSNALSKFVKHINEPKADSELEFDDENTVAFVDLGHKNVLIDIASGGKIALSRIVDSGFLDQDVFISNRFGIGVEEAGKLRREKLNSNMLDVYYLYNQTKDFIFDDGDSDSNNPIGEGPVSQSDKELFMLLNESMVMYDELNSEISKVLNYYTSRADNQKIDRVVLHGLSTESESLVEFFDTVLDFDVETINFDNISGVDFAGGIENKSAYINALGALIRYKEG